jgi:hypothetical protein
MSKYLKHCSNWQVIASYLIHGIQPEEVFKCFEFPDQTFSDRYRAYFLRLVTDMKLPSAVRFLCGKYSGQQPGLGYRLDNKVFEILFQRFLQPNTSKPNSKQIKVTAAIINLVVSEVLKNMDENGRSYFVGNKLRIIPINFQYSADAITNFFSRWFFTNQYTVRFDPALSVKNKEFKVTQYAIDKNYPINGYSEILEKDEYIIATNDETDSLFGDTPSILPKRIALPAGSNINELLKKHRMLEVAKTNSFALDPLTTDKSQVTFK